tara:strand:+ start:215 stop:625 length:411 start_codon:yes stop_codon:yes gene_type:complete
MEKKISNNEQEIKKRNPSKAVQINQKRLPWWVELLFVQIGLPDKWLIKILKTKKTALDFYKNEKKTVFLIFLFIFTLGYFNPVIRYSRSKIRCQQSASNYIYEITSLQKNNLKKVDMLTVNFCNGGDELKNFMKSQ